MKLRYILFSLIMLPFLEFAFFGAVSGKIGLIPAFFGLFGISFYGFYLLKSQGKLLVKALKSGENVVFTGEAAKKGLSTALAALLFAFPGFLSDIAGLVILILGGRIPLPTPEIYTRRDNDGIIDLSPEEYSEKKPRKRRIKSDLKQE